MKWIPGRQNSGYFKLKLLQLPFLDVHLLRYPEGSSIPEHTDPIPKKKHYRVNLILKHAEEGGEFSAVSTIFCTSRVKVFRSDQPHQVSKITKGNRLVLSIGYYETV